MNYDLRFRFAAVLLIITFIAMPESRYSQRTQKPVLYGRHWVAVTGKPVAATAGARIFMKGGNAVDAACAMIAATSTMWDTLSWGGETVALVYDPRAGKVRTINALGVPLGESKYDSFQVKANKRYSHGLNLT